MTYRYCVKTVCSVTLIKTWTVTADRPLTKDAIREARETRTRPACQTEGEV